MKAKQWAVWVMAAVMVAGTPTMGRAQEKRGEESRAPEEAVARLGAEVREAEQEADRVAEEVRVSKAKRGKKGLVLHYSFRKGGKWGAGAVVRDLSGRGHDGRVEGDGLEVVEGFGKRGTAARFDGTGDYIRVPRDAELEPQELTVAAWVRMRKGDTWENASTIAFKRNSSFHHNEGYDLELFPDRTARSTIAGPNAAQSRIQSTVPMADGVWHHVAMTHKPDDTRLYIDGTLAGEGAYPGAVVHNAEADLLIGGRDHAAYPMGNFGMYDLGEIKVWNEALGAEKIARLHAQQAGRPGIGEAGTDWKALSEFGADRRLDSHGIVPERKPVCRETIPVCRPPRMFPPWKPADESVGSGSGLEAEVRTLVAQGRRDRAASPEFLAALEALMGKYAAEGTPLDRLPLKPVFRGPGMPAGWNAVVPSVWRFGDGMARQVESKADTRYVLFYEPGMAWTDYEVTFRFESDAWLAPPANSCAVLYFRYRATDDTYSLWLDGKGRLTVVSMDKGCGNRQRLLARVPLDTAVVKDGKPWTVKVHGENIEVWHEGQRLLWTTDRAHRSGTVGLESVHIPMAFSGVSVAAL